MRLTIILLAITTTSLLIAAREVRSADASEHPPATLPGLSPEQQPPERSLVGILDQVDATATHIVIKTTSGKQTFTVQSGATIRQGSKTIKATELGAHRGERVKVRYREAAGGLRHAEWIIFASPSPPPQPPPSRTAKQRVN